MQQKGRSEKKGKLVSLFVGIGISAALIAGFAYAIDWKAFGAELHRINPVLLLPSCCFVVAAFWLRALRWKLLLPKSDTSSTRVRFDAIAVSFLATFILPFRAGEIIRAWALYRWEGTPIATGFASVVVERAFDVLAVLFLLGLALMHVDKAPPEVISGAVALAAFAGVILAGMIASYFFSAQMLAMLKWGLNLILSEKRSGLRDAILKIGEEFIGGLKAISSVKELGAVLVWSLVLWTSSAGSLYSTLLAFGEHPSFWVAIGTSSIIALAVAIPSAPGFLGTYHFGCWVALSLVYGYTKDLAVAVAVVLHTINLVMIVALGIWVLKNRGMSFRDLKRRDAE